MQREGVGQTDKGADYDHNEDAFVADDDLGLYIVSDGVGGQAAGDVASAMAVRSATQLVASAHVAGIDEDRARGLVEAAVAQACHDVYELADSNVAYAGMGCSLTIVLVGDGFAALGHVGDSRCYLVRGDEASQITTDHTVASELRRAGVTDEVAPRTAGVLTRCVGTHESVRVDTAIIGLLAGDRLLLCTDGLSNRIDSQEWLVDEAQGDSLDANIENLIQHAREHGSGDNVTVVLVACEPEEGAEAGATTRRLEVGARLKALQQVFLFKDLSLGLLTRLVGSCRVQRLRKGAVLVKEGAACERMIVTVAGRIRVERGGQIRGELGPGDFSGLTAMLHPRPSRATLVAIEDSSVLSVDRDVFWSLAQTRPWLAVNLLERLVRRLSMDLDDSIDARDDADARTSELGASQLV